MTVISIQRKYVVIDVLANMIIVIMFKLLAISKLSKESVIEIKNLINYYIKLFHL